MIGKPKNLWGKLSQKDSRDRHSEIIAWHPLVDHCHDAAACLWALLQIPVIRRRVEDLLGCELTEVVVMRLVLFAFLHDIGKGNSGFQFKPFKMNSRSWVGAKGHLKEAMNLLCDQRYGDLALQSLRFYEMINWSRNGEEDLIPTMCSVWSHHGKPVNFGQISSGVFDEWSDYEWAGAEKTLFAFSTEINSTYGQAFEPGPKMNMGPKFQAFFCGLLSLADWLSSSKEWFPYSMPGDPPRFPYAQKQALDMLSKMGMDADNRRSAILNKLIDYHTVFGIKTPNSMQRSMMSLPLGSQIVGEAFTSNNCKISTNVSKSAGTTALLESETGSGKTDAAIMHGLILYLLGSIDSIYFALPTRTSAVQMYKRVLRAVSNTFGEHAPPVVLAVPGYMSVDGVSGIKLPDFKTKWDDENDAFRARGWFAENSKRYLAAPIAIGTVDQALMSVIKTKHAHMRSVCLSRSLLVLDEVHASDPYMTELQSNVIKRQEEYCGHSLLMSATLASETASRYLGCAKLDFKSSVQAPYPLIRMRNKADGSLFELAPLPDVGARTKQIRMEVSSLIGNPKAIAKEAEKHARRGAKVLIIRNTVAECIAIRKELSAFLPEEYIFQCNGVPTCHHGRFAPDDRILLDNAVEFSFGKKRPSGGMVLVATQTVEQSIDIDADILITDICPIDVLLQRLGRLHRHLRPSDDSPNGRPEGYETPRCIVLVPTHSLISMTIRAKHGIGPDRAYPDVRIVEMTRRLIAEHPVFDIPRMNRFLVESAIHSESLAILSSEDKQWLKHGGGILGDKLASGAKAKENIYSNSVEFGLSNMANEWNQSLDVATRLGENPITVMFPNEQIPLSPFSPASGKNRIFIKFINLPNWMIPKDRVEKVTQDLVPTNIRQLERGFSFDFAGESFVYDQDGLMKS